VPNYIDNKEFERLIKDYLNDKATHESELIAMFDLLITNIIDSFNFKIDKEDAKQECFLLVIKVLSNFNPEQGSAFNYFTTIIINNLKLVYTKNKKYQEKLSTYMNIVAGYNPSSLKT
jgi:DNA-directed RNA polymerase specialized sigma subunit